MKTQNLKNHRKFVLGYHLVTFLAIVILLIGSIVNFTHSSETNRYSASLLILLSVILLFLWFFVRTFATKLQDRTIRAEENFRHYVLAGKPLSNALTMPQIVGLRFASDEEFLGLAERAEKENLSREDIKKAIKKWKPDTNRI